MTTHKTKALIIGAGPAGYTAGIYAARANMKPILVTGIQPGGQLTITTDVENYPGFAAAVQGPDLMEQMRLQAEHVGTQILYDTIVSVDLSKRPFVAQGDGGDTYVADTLIAATGAQARWLGLPSEIEFNGAGVSACATCDGFFYRGKEVVVIGGGNTAVEEALYLANLASKVTVVHRRDRFRAEPILQDRLFAHPKIEVVWNHVVDEVLGRREPVKAVTGVRLRDANSGATRDVPADGLFVAIGHDPATKLFTGQLELLEGGYIKIVPGTTRTNVEGVYAAGDCAEFVYRQAVVAAGMGCMAALEAEKFLAEHSPDPQVRKEELQEPEMIGAYD
ncbi:MULTISPECIES: thioredoxin-disulfide reductase [Methylobacteriaceae]|jgi:thioredoxin reductase (NADPH)|uniref:Thioredoxin reductase n=2 Tax=Methylobacteriaceae TaxID=119045 RepID=A0ABU9Z7E9_9HYPH|nr:MULTISPECIES: thioredoxin-disulfide reductase [Methylobacteriaceae]MBK3404083.1 thioredoxin-disulfide reductase [Methylorubrum rhodesianum]MBY0139500.1 thioredoxin-disulfide reductase [Methylorubrum populi]GJD87941.1 Thioredoxin reductase [Methylobacterium hispanicum]